MEEDLMIVIFCLIRFTKKFFSFLLVLASDHANVDVRILYTPNHHQVLESMSDSHQEQEQLLYSYRCKYQEF